MRSLELKLPPVALTLLLGGLMWATTLIGPDFGFTLPGRLIVAAGLAAAGMVIAVLGVLSFRRAKTTVNPLHPETVSALVASGIYQLTRNPMYLGLLLMLLGEAVFLANGLTFIFPIAYVPVMNRLQIIPEERALAARFGSGFADYKSKVRRWL